MKRLSLPLILQQLWPRLFYKDERTRYVHSNHMPAHPPYTTTNFTSLSINGLPLSHGLPLLDGLVTSLLSPLIPPSQPCLFEGHSPSPTLTTQFEPDRSLPGPCVILSPMAHVSPPLCCLAPDHSHPTPSCHFKPNGSCLTLSVVSHQIIHISMPFMSFRARLLISHPNHAQTLISVSL